ncbi:type IV pilus assembly protein PilA [Bhargavaea ginsengi]|uniref:Type IV pilus assembly protein PilA n=1 Tax=Bhargavaea ginsengi TaxID=426757 RepID=A0A1H6XJH7_9BACL|nr:prepilin-type N-terminal cleavage/methylation domain-containing protein [Bhargavaea ginsengi]MCM3086603.1 prepilin-type N-terminal cleavage/methylation domain-containing protein [Bhargavaea ginsengi]SEJ25000.1 type IV pilus assembly protein PilA [Bhargavaea ginsengi]
MLKFVQKKLKEEKGLTLIELLAVIVILAIIAAIAIPAIGNIIQNSREDAVVSDAQNILAAANIYFAENGDVDQVEVGDPEASDTDNAGTLIGEGYLETKGEIDNATVANVANGANTITFTATAGSRDVTVENPVTAGQLSDEGRDLLIDQ